MNPNWLFLLYNYAKLIHKSKLKNYYGSAIGAL